jgi:cellulose synthase/poly-beta-1,6-N-acetylglucosamine synthase-like glycosyltransferase
VILFYVNMAFIGLAVISIIYYLVNSYHSINYRQPTGTNPVYLDRVTALIPVYNEDPEIFARVIAAVKKQGIKFVVVGDSSFDPYRKITDENGGTFIYLPKHGGKRKAVSEGIREITTDFVLLVDSDTIIPAKTVSSMLSKFDPDVGGIGANLSVRRDDNWISYSAEFVERSREVLFRSLSSHGSVMLLDGACVMYRTSLVKPFILSSEYTDHRVFGKKSQLGDDRQLTGFVIRSNYKAIKDFDVAAEVTAPKTVGKLVRQNIRWARSNWVNFFRELFNGTAKKAGKFYTFDLLYTYMLPIIFLGIGFVQVYLFFHIDYHFLVRHLTHVPSFTALMSRMTDVKAVFFLRLLLTLVNYVSTAVFTLAIAFRINKERLKTLAYGSIAMAVMLTTTIYGLLTIWKQNGWMTR